MLYYFKVWVPPNFDVVSIVFDCLINLYGETDYHGKRKCLWVFIETFLLGNFVSYVSTEIFKVYGERTCTTNL